MRLQLISDLHTEFITGNESLILESLPIEKDLDFLVIAGDLVVPGDQGILLVKEIFGIVSRFARYVLYLPGNHEYYHGSKAWTEGQLKTAIADYPNIIYLDNNEVTIEGVHFIGGTMWYPTGDGLNAMYARQMSDSRVIQGFNWAERENIIFTHVVNAYARPDSIVITHHLPHALATPRIYRDSDLNRFFVSDQSYAMKTKRPKLWLFGHTHSPCDIVFESTRMVCNPYGYPSERGGRPYPAVVFDV